MIGENIKYVATLLHHIPDKKMMKRYMLDISSILVIGLIAIILSGKPVINDGTRQISNHLIKTPSAESLKELRGIDRPVFPDQALKERNIFTATGTSVESTARVMPENPYALIAVLLGKEKKAVFRDYLGNVLTLRAGEKLIDGFVVARIDAVSVHLRKRDEQKDLRLFSAEGRLSTRPSAVDQANALPKNLYTLIGILAGKEKKAVFKDYKGSVLILAVGEKLLDGSVITNIDNSIVSLKKSNEKKELKIFNSFNTEQSIRNKR
jgi:hypothetical protein